MLGKKKVEIDKEINTNLSSLQGACALHVLFVCRLLLATERERRGGKKVGLLSK